MKYISIVTGSDLRMVMGVNYFIKSFIECNKLFDRIKLTHVYSGVQSLNIENGDNISIGADLGTAEYKRRRGLRSILRRILNDKIYLFLLFRYELNKHLVSSKSNIKLFKENPDCNCIIFQEIGCAEYYYKHINEYPNFKHAKCILIIHSENDSGSMLVETFNGWGRKDMQRRYNKMRDYVYERIDKVLYISKKAYDASILPANKKALIYNGSPVVDYSFGHEVNSIVNFVCVGSIEGRKGQDIIVDALKIMPKELLEKIHVTFVGGGSKEQELKQQVSEYGLDDKVTFTGRRNDVSDLLKAMDVFIMPSTIEGLPMSAIEALRAGLYLILTDTGGNAELCDKECGCVCERKAVDVMKKMVTVLDRNIITKEQKEHNHQRFLEEFSLESMAKKYEELVLNLTK